MAVSPRHMAMILEESGIDRAVARERGYWTAKDAAELIALGFEDFQARVPALGIPLYPPGALSREAETRFYQIRSDNPRVNTKGKIVKYEPPVGSEVVLDVHPRMQERIKDPAWPLFITEGIKKGDALVSRDLCAAALAGVWNWRGKNEHGGKTAIEDFEAIALNGRRVYVVFDSDVMVKPEVHASLARLKPFLERRGANVALIYLPAGDGAKKQGVDDYLAAGHSVEDLLSLATSRLKRIEAELAGDGNDSNDSSFVRLPEALTFPTTALPEAARRFVEEGSEAIGCAPELLGMPALSVLSSAVGASRLAEIKRSWKEGATLFLAAVASPGEKKTPAATAATVPVRKLQSEYRRLYKRKAEEHAQDVRDWKADVRVAHKEQASEPPPPIAPVMERTFADDTTIESLVGILEDNPRGVLVEKDELTGWVRGMDQYKSGGKGADRQHWLSMWSNKTVVVDRKSRQGDPIYVERPFVTVFGGIQPVMLAELGGAGSLEDGLLDRFLFAYPAYRRVRHTDREISAETERAYEALYLMLRHKLQMAEDEYGEKCPATVPLSFSARALFRELHDALGEETTETGFPVRLRGVWAKLQGYLVRIALTLAMCRCLQSGESEQVEREDLEAAARLVGYFKAHARRVYAELRAATPQDLLAGELRDFLEEEGEEWSGTASKLYDELESREAQGLPENAEWLSKMVRSIGERSESLEVKAQRKNIKGKVQRVLSLRLTKTTVHTVHTVHESQGNVNSMNSSDGSSEEVEF